MFAVGSVLSAFAPSIAVLIAGRLIVGIGIGVSSVAAPLYISEAAPRATRGCARFALSVAITIGILCAALVDYAFAASADWPAMLGIALVPSVLLVAGMIVMPESPRWLYAHGQEALARQVLMHTRDAEEVEHAIADIKSSLGVHQGEFRDLFSPRVRGALGIGIGLAVLQQITGINTVIYYGPQIFKLAGFSSNAVSILATLGVDLVNCLMDDRGHRLDRPDRTQAAALRRNHRYDDCLVRARLRVRERRQWFARRRNPRGIDGLCRLLRVQPRPDLVAS